MPDIIEQLEAGKKLQEEEGIDVDSLRTKIGSSEEEVAEKPKRGRKKKEELLKEKPVEKKPMDPFEQAEELAKKLAKPERTSSSDIDKDVQEEKYPGFDFNNYYTKGQTIYYVKLNNMTGDKEFLELKIRSIYPKFMVACTEKAFAQCLGPDVQDYIFADRYTAVECYNNAKVEQRVYIKDDLGDVELNTEE